MNIKDDIRDRINNLINQSADEELLTKLKYFLFNNDIDANIHIRIKSIDSAFKKIDEKNYTDANQVTDLLGAMITTDSAENIYKIKSFLEKTTTLVGVSDYIKDPRESGYSACHLDVLIGGIGTEIQIKTLGMELAQKITHDTTYKHPFPKESLSADFKEFLNRVSRDVFKQYTETLPADFSVAAKPLIEQFTTEIDAINQVIQNIAQDLSHITDPTGIKGNLKDKTQDLHNKIIILESVKSAISASMYNEQFVDFTSALTETQNRADQTPQLPIETPEEKDNDLHPLDEITIKHQTKVAILCAKLGSELGLNDTQLKQLIEAAKIHDIGKMGVPQSILDKPGKLTKEEFTQIKKHTIAGFDLCKQLNVDETVSKLVRSHHEKLDGTGYPEKLKADEINLNTRILTVADIYEAFTAKRQYKQKMTHEETITIMNGLDFNKAIDINILAALNKVIARDNDLSFIPSITDRLSFTKKISFASEKKTISKFIELAIINSKTNEKSIKDNRIDIPSMKQNQER